MDVFFQSESSPALLILRLCLAVVFFAHGSQHFAGWFGGRGLKSTVTNWNERYQIPVAIGVIGVFTEFFGSFALVIGFMTRLVVLGLMIFMWVAMRKGHWGNGFFMAHGPGSGSGIEYCLVLLLMNLALLVGGGGVLSLDRWLAG